MINFLCFPRKIWTIGDPKVMILESIIFSLLERSFSFELVVRLLALKDYIRSLSKVFRYPIEFKVLVNFTWDLEVDLTFEFLFCSLLYENYRDPFWLLIS